MDIRLKRVYDEPAADDGFRVLVDRLWPRGLTKERADVDLWAKDVAPSAQLRTEFHHDGLAWADFTVKYRAEMVANPAVGELRDTLAKHPVVTLLFGSRDTEHNEAVLLREEFLG